MAIEIKPTQTGITQSLMQKPLKAEATADTTHRSTRTDTVTVTSAAEDLFEMEKKLSTLSGSDEARVASIKEQVQSGSFQIDVAKIAEKLIQQEQELL